MLLIDSYDGRIDHVYPVRCYHQAVTHLPIVLQLYSTERDDILRALQRAVAGKGTSPTIFSPHATASDGSLPIPLLILGSVAILLVAAGIAGVVWRWIQSRRGVS